MIETIMTICSLYIGSPAAQCRVHIRHCVEEKYKARNRQYEIKAKRLAKERDNLCKTKVANRDYCDVARISPISAYYSDFITVDTTEKDFTEECAKKEGVI